MAANDPKQREHRAAVIPLPRRPTFQLRLDALVPTTRSIAVGVALVVACCLAYVVARFSPLFALDRVEVKGASPALAARIRAALEPLDGESLLAFRAGRADARLAQIPEVASATYDRDFPHTLRIAVRAERAVGVVRRGNDAFLVSSSGRVLRALPRTHLGPLPRIWVPKDDLVRVGERLADPAALRAVGAVDPLARMDFPARVRFVRSTPKELTLVLASGVELRLGDLDRLGLKLAVAARILPQVEQPPKGVPYLDLTVPERPVGSTSTVPTNTQPGG